MGKKNRIYNLKALDVDEQEALSARDNMQADEDYELFLQELDADKEMRGTVNLYSNPATKKMAATSSRRAAERVSGTSTARGEDGDADSDMAVGEGEDEEEVRLDELLDGLQLRQEGSDVDGEDIAVLTAEQATVVPAVELDLADGFNEASFDPKDFKFT